MEWKRRDVIRAGLGLGAGLFLWGCTDQKKLAGGGWPPIPWPDAPLPRTIGPALMPSPGQAPPPPGIGSVMARSSWTRNGPIISRLNPMNGISRITLHHEGAPDTPVYFTDTRTVAERIELDRQAHLERGWGDIGYHYIIDRAGRVWEGRPIQYQGAHVRDNNEHNIGVMCMGNFDIQQPSEAQLSSLAAFTQKLRRKHNVSVNRVFTHQELMPTHCPGRSMQPRIAAMRSGGAFA